MNLIAECKEKVVDQKWGIHWVIGDIEISESKHVYPFLNQCIH